MKFLKLEKNLLKISFIVSIIGIFALTFVAKIDPEIMDLKDITKKDVGKIDVISAVKV